MSTRLSVFALSAILIASMGVSPIFGQIAEPIVVTTDKASYGNGDTIMVTGEVKELLSGFPVTLQLIAANGNLVTVQQLDVGADRTFGIELTAGGPLWKAEGTYTIKVLYGTESRTAEATFDFGGEGGTTTTPPPSTGPTVMVERTEFSVGYSITGGSIVSIAPDDEANVVLPAVPIEASSAYCVAVYVLSTSNDMNATNATVANAAAISSKITAIANSISDFSLHANALNKRFVLAIIIPAKNIAFNTPDLITNKPPKSVNITVVIQPKVFE